MKLSRGTHAQDGFCGNMDILDYAMRELGIIPCSPSLLLEGYNKEIIYLLIFILCTEVLISNLHAVESGGRLVGLKVVQASRLISHMLFADDSLFFCKVTVGQSEELLLIINQYGNASGQRINLDKSTITFGKDVPNDERVAIKKRLGFPTEGGGGHTEIYGDPGTTTRV